MEKMNITCYKGTGANDSKKYLVDPQMKISEFRTLLTGDNFIPPESKEFSYSFIVFGDIIEEELQEDGHLVARNLEKWSPLISIVGHARQVIITNVNAKQKPDLAGIATGWFFNRHLGVQVVLNNEDPKGAEVNTRIKAFPPMQLTNVRPTGKQAFGIYDNVCVCVENSAVQFNIHSWASAGYEFYIAPQSGEPICGGGLYVVAGDNPNQFLATSLRRYASKPQTIQIVGADSAGIPNWETVRFQKVTVKSRRITSYYEGSRLHSSTGMPPMFDPSRGMSRSMARYAAGAGTGFDRQRALVNAKSLAIVPGDSIKPGGPVAGAGSDQGFGSGIHDVRTDDWTEALGEVVIYFFVFKDWDSANRVITGYNAPDPNLWA